MAEVPTIELVGLNDAQKTALRLADNKIALGAGWDLDILKVELAELFSLDLDMDLTVTGFSTGELDVLLSRHEDPEDDVIPPVPDEPRTRPGDIWILGDHVVGCGDSRDLELLQKVVGDGAASTPPSSTRRTTSGSAVTPTRKGATGSSRWRQAR